MQYQSNDQQQSGHAKEDAGDTIEAGVIKSG